MNTLVRDLSEKTVRELKRRAAEKNRSLQAEIKAILDETAKRRRHLRKWNKNVDRIFNELKKSGKKFPDSAAMIRKHRDG
jgi:plasmid stability protein